MKLCCLLLAAGIAFAQTTRYPGALDSDSSLFVVSDNVQTTLNTAMAIADTTAIVANAAGFVPNMIVTICDTSTNTGKCTAWEHMLVTAAAGNVLTVTRGVAGTSARAHSSGRLVSALIDSAHQKVLKDAVVAIETALGPNFRTSAGLITSGTYTFSPYSCNSSAACAPGGPSGMGLIAGNNTLTMAPVPPGVNGTDTGHSLYVSGGTGAAQACLITGGSGRGGDASGQIIVNCPHTHTGAWTIAGATGGIQEAICSFPVTGGTVIVQQSVALSANVTDCGKTGTTSVNTQAGVTLSGAFTIFGNPLADGDAQVIYTKAFRGHGAFSFGTGFTPQADMFVMDYTVTAPGDGTSGWGPAAINFRTDAAVTAGTIVAMESQLFLTNNVLSNGSTAILGSAFAGAGVTSILIGVHGQCDITWAGNPACIAVNAEGSGTTGTNGTLIGYSSNMNANTPTGASITVLGAQVQMNNTNSNMKADSVGVQVQASGGTVPAGVYIRDAGGKFSRPLMIESSQHPSTTIGLINTTPGTDDAATTIAFYRGSLANLYATIQGDNAPFGFNTGSLTFKTAAAGVMTEALVLNNDGSVKIGKGGATNRAACWKPDGKTVGQCASIVNPDGTCTCI